ncbi:unnamed protein product [Clavelina lepadiformis]|uniref:Nuclear receptor domain-containing protein n=1 Tax=Clavelina lepadiformis TaxID=159417 RepID=A0ABP0FYL7_CLALP
MNNIEQSDRQIRHSDVMQFFHYDDFEYGALNPAAADHSANHQEAQHSHMGSHQIAVQMTQTSVQRAMPRYEDPEQIAGPSFAFATEHNDVTYSFPSDNVQNLMVPTYSGHRPSDHGSSTSQHIRSQPVADTFQELDFSDDESPTSARAMFDDIPCKVCEDKSSGIHYGVVCCEGCKAFFRRCLPPPKDFKCIGDGNCVVDYPNRNRCPYCRWKKCLKVGMKRNGTKLGRKSKKGLKELSKLKKTHKKKRASNQQHESHSYEQSSSGLACSSRASSANAPPFYTPSDSSVTDPQASYMEAPSGGVLLSSEAESMTEFLESPLPQFLTSDPCDSTTTVVYPQPDFTNHLSLADLARSAFSEETLQSSDWMNSFLEATKENNE